MATAMSWTSWLASTSPPSTSQVFRILPRSGMIAWNSLSRACLAEPPAESPSTRNSSARIGSCPAQSASLPGSAGPLGDLLALDLLARLEATPGVADRQLRQLQAQFGVGVEPQAEGILHHAGDERRALAGRQALLGLPGELRILHLHREHEGDALPDVFGRQLDAARQQVAEFAELAHGVEQALAQAVDVGAALGGGDQVDVAFVCTDSPPSGSHSRAQSTASLLPARLPQNGSSGSAAARRPRRSGRNAGRPRSAIRCARRC